MLSTIQVQTEQWDKNKVDRQILEDWIYFKMNLLVIGVPFAALILSNAFASAAIFNGVLQLTIFIVIAMIPGKLVVHLDENQTPKNWKSVLWRIVVKLKIVRNALWKLWIWLFLKKIGKSQWSPPWAGTQCPWHLISWFDNDKVWILNIYPAVTLKPTDGRWRWILN